MSDDTKKKKISLPIAGDESPVSATPKSRQQGGDIHSEIEKEVTENDIVLYMKGVPQQPRCGFSARAAQILASYGHPFFAVDILQDPEKRQGIKDYSDWPTVPQVYIGGEFVGGSDILMEMHENNEIKPLIDAATDGG